ncbi:protease, partial [Cytidiella melzeri]
GGIFINQELVSQYQIKTTMLPRPIQVFNVNGAEHSSGEITRDCYLTLCIGTEERETQFLLTALGKEQSILGLPWLRKENPRINWSKGNL